MKWLEKHSDIFFKYSGYYLIFTVAYGIGLTVLVALPRSSPLTWTADQWKMIQFFLEPGAISWFVSTIFAILCFRKKYVVFIIMFIYLLPNFPSILKICLRIFNHGFLYFPTDLSNIIGILTMSLSIIGSILWIRNLSGKDKIKLSQVDFGHK